LMRFRDIDATISMSIIALAQLYRLDFNIFSYITRSRNGGW
jgi:hypothetical protein